jgi:hypothetical protein
MSKTVGKTGMAGVLVLMAFGVFVMPVAVPATADISAASKVLLALILVCGIAAISEYKRAATLLAALSVAIAVAWIVGAAAWHDTLLLIALLVLATAIGINVFAARRGVADRLFGAIALYVLIGGMFAAVYAIIAEAAPHAFAGSLPQRTTMFDWGYFSFVTLTTVGYGDITPTAHVARSLAILEALIGQLYPAIIIARLISAQPTR